jgi:hypothetical protein
MKFTEIGSVVAFLTAAFVLYDRLVAGRPLASISKSGRGQWNLRLTKCQRATSLFGASRSGEKV